VAKAKAAVKKAAKKTTGKRIATAAKRVGRKLADAARAVVDQIATAVEHAAAPPAAKQASKRGKRGAQVEAPVEAATASGEASTGGGGETISAADEGGDAADEEDEPARPATARLQVEALRDDLRDDAELLEAERLRQELEHSRRLSAELDGPDDDLSLPRDPDGLLEPRDDGSLDEELTAD